MTASFEEEVRTGIHGLFACCSQVAPQENAYELGSEGEKSPEQEQEKKEKRDEIEKTQKEYSSPFQVDVTVKFKRKEDK